MSRSYLRPLGFGEVLDAGFTLYRRHFAAMLLIAVITFIPVSLATSGMMHSMAGADAADPTAALRFLPLFLISAVAMVVTWAALTRGAAQAATGGAVSVGDGLRSGLRAFFPLLIATTLAYLGLVGMILVPGVVLAILIPLLGAGKAVTSAVVGGVIGVAALVLMLGGLAALFAVAPAVVVERKGPIAAIRRSLQLSKGARLRILGVLLVTWLIVWLPTMGVMVAAGMGSAMFSANAAAGLTTGQLIFQQIVGFISGSLTFPFFATCVVMLYFDRRVRVEAYDLEVETQELSAIS